MDKLSDVSSGEAVGTFACGRPTLAFGGCTRTLSSQSLPAEQSRGQRQRLEDVSEAGQCRSDSKQKRRSSSASSSCFGEALAGLQCIIANRSLKKRLQQSISIWRPRMPERTSKAAGQVAVAARELSMYT